MSISETHRHISSYRLAARHACLETTASTPEESTNVKRIFTADPALSCFTQQDSKTMTLSNETLRHMWTIGWLGSGSTALDTPLVLNADYACSIRSLPNATLLHTSHTHSTNSGHSHLAPTITTTLLVRTSASSRQRDHWTGERQLTSEHSSHESRYLYRPWSFGRWRERGTEEAETFRTRPLPCRSEDRDKHDCLAAIVYMWWTTAFIFQQSHRLQLFPQYPR